MTEKEITSILYQTLHNAGRVEIKIVNGIDYQIFKSANNEEYMVCVLYQGINNSHSGVLSTINDCYDWISSN